jgi:hypothetical protein
MMGGEVIEVIKSMLCSPEEVLGFVPRQRWSFNCKSEREGRAAHLVAVLVP